MQITLQKLGLKTDLIVDIPDHVDGDTRWYQKAQFNDMEFSLSRQYVEIKVEVFAFTKLEDGSFKHLSQIPGKKDSMIADFSTIVDMQGNFLYKDVPMMSEEDTEAMYPDLAAIQWAREGELFCIMAQQMDLRVIPMIEAKILSKYIIAEPPVVE
jgi:hypothetical protein